MILVIILLYITKWEQFHLNKKELYLVKMCTCDSISKFATGSKETIVAPPKYTHVYVAVFRINPTERNLLFIIPWLFNHHKFTPLQATRVGAYVIRDTRKAICTFYVQTRMLEPIELGCPNID